MSRGVCTGGVSRWCYRLLPPANGVVKVMFSVLYVSVSLSVSLSFHRQRVLSAGGRLAFN